MLVLVKYGLDEVELLNADCFADCFLSHARRRARTLLRQSLTARQQSVVATLREIQSSLFRLRKISPSLKKAGKHPSVDIEEEKKSQDEEEWESEILRLEEEMILRRKQEDQIKNGLEVCERLLESPVDLIAPNGVTVQLEGKGKTPASSILSARTQYVLGVLEVDEKGQKVAKPINVFVD